MTDSELLTILHSRIENGAIRLPGGRTNQRLVTALKRMPGCECKGVV